MDLTISAPPNALNWFAIPAADFERAVRFYEAILETKLKVGEFGPRTIGVFAHAEDGVGGCIASGTPSPDGVLVYLNADGRLDRTLELVASAGGRIAVPKFELPYGQGHSAQIVDSEGNHVGLHAKA